MDRQKVSEYWAAKAHERAIAAGRVWTDSSIVMKRYIHPVITGDPDKNWFIWVKETFLREPAERALNIGCGDGCLERHGAAINVFRHCDAVDISEGAIELARARARELGIGERISYEVKDVNAIVLPRSHYDVVFCAMSLHHVERLEHVLAEIKASLKPHGLLIVNEYVGPNRFQWTEEQLRIANDLLQLLPERYRYNPSTKTVKTIIERQSLEHMTAVDPSEAVRSADIISLIEEHFEIVRRIDYGGTIVNLLLEDLILNFDEDAPEDMAILDMIFYLERLAIDSGILKSDFTVVVAKKPPDDTGKTELSE